MYEVSKLIIQVIGQSKETKREVVLKLGYKNLDKGYRRLYHLIETGECPEPIKKMLPTALGVLPQVVEDAFETTARQKQEEVEIARRCQEEYERRIFKPHLWIEHVRKRPPVGTICIVAFIGIENFKVLNLPKNINQLDWSEQIRLVQERIRLHQKEEGTDDHIFGRVEGYIYRQTYNESFMFSRDGVLLKRDIGKVHIPEVSLKIGNKEISSGLLKIMNKEAK